MRKKKLKTLTLYVNQFYAYMPVVLVEHVSFYIPSPDLLIIALHDDLLFA